ncbi:MAG: hypothetical protein ACXADH_00350 [Candidatus Kariarchaeaceae archaeon]|jgi:hypothetical protein
MKELYGCLCAIGLMFCFVVFISALGVMGCRTVIKMKPSTEMTVSEELSDEARMDEVRRKLEMLQNNQNY